MGQQQLILIVLGAMVVGLAAYGAIRVMDANNQSNDENLIQQQMNVVLTEAQKYSAKIATLGGGAGSFTGFKAPNNMLNTQRVRLFVSLFDQWIIFQGYGTVKGKNGSTAVYIIALYNGYQDRWELMLRIN